MIYTVAFRIHIVVSAITLLAGIGTIVLALHGWSSRRQYERKDEWFSVVYNVALYLQLILGFIIYFALRTDLESPAWEVPDTENDASLRFWAIEHIALMIFALFLTQLGRVYIKKSMRSLQKFRASVFYNGTSLLLIFFSLSIALFFR